MCYGVLMCLDVFRRDIRERRERIRLELPRKSFFFFFFFFFWVQNEGFWGIYSENVTLQLPTHLVGRPVTLLMLAILAFFSSNSDAYLNAFLDLD